MSVWVIAKTYTAPNGSQITAYWCGGSDGLIGDVWRPLKEHYRGDDSVGVIAIWATERAALMAHRKVFGEVFGKRRVVKLSAETRRLWPVSHGTR
jgi:hypothetical protein